MGLRINPTRPAQKCLSIPGSPSALGPEVRATLQRAFSVLFGIALLVLLLGTLYQWEANRTLDSFVLIRFAIILTGLLIMARAVLTTPTEAEHERCPRCGSRVFETLRSEDRQRVLTCFGCGTEVGERPRAGPGSPETLRPA